MKCKKCDNKSVKNGKQSGIQRYYCNSCKYSFQEKYIYTSYSVKEDEIKTLVKEGCGIRSISRILEISPSTVITRIKRIARGIRKPNFIPIGKEYPLVLVLGNPTKAGACFQRVPKLIGAFVTQLRLSF